MKILTICFLCVCSILLLVVSLPSSFFSSEESESTVDPLYSIENISECYNMTFISQVECIRDYIKPFYNYTIRDDTLKSLEDIKINGGDCFEYSHLYKELAEELGLNARVDKIYGTGYYAHAYIVIWDNELTGYCTTSGLYLNCRDLT